jgi:hypothetical protein
MDGDCISYKPLGKCPTPGHLYKALAKCPEVIAAMNAAITSRKNPFSLQIRQGMSGCTDYLLREHRDEAWCDYPVRARLHVSMYGKLNEPFSMWIGDFAHLIEAAIEDYMPDDLAAPEWSELRVEEAPIYQPPPQPATRLVGFEIDVNKGARRIFDPCYADQVAA